MMNSAVESLWPEEETRWVRASWGHRNHPRKARGRTIGSHSPGSAEDMVGEEQHHRIRGQHNPLPSPRSSLRSSSASGALDHGGGRIWRRGGRSGGARDGEGEGAIGCGGAEETAANGIGVRARTRKEEMEAGARQHLFLGGCRWERRGNRRSREARSRGDGWVGCYCEITTLPFHPWNAFGTIQAVGSHEIDGQDMVPPSLKTVKNLFFHYMLDQ